MPSSPAAWLDRRFVSWQAYAPAASCVWGCLLASVGLMKFLTMGIAVSLTRVGVPISVVELVVFPTIALANLVTVTLLLRISRNDVF